MKNNTYRKREARVPTADIISPCVLGPEQPSKGLQNEASATKGRTDQAPRGSVNVLGETVGGRTNHRRRSPKPRPHLSTFIFIYLLSSLTSITSARHVHDDTASWCVLVLRPLSMRATQAALHLKQRDDTRSAAYQLTNCSPSTTPSFRLERSFGASWAINNPT